MFFNLKSDVPIYFQIADIIKENILSENIKEDDKVPSTNEISLNYGINPATIRKGFDILVNEEIIYKKRGLGMFVVKGAREKIMKKRKEEFFNEYVIKLIEEAKKLNISKSEVLNMIEKSTN